MNITWTNDDERRFVPVRVRDGAAESDYIAAIRGIATVANVTGGYAILLDLREVSDMPDFAGVMKMAREMEHLKTPAADHIAVLACPKGAVYGKGRQIIAILLSLGISAELFATEPDAMDWLGARLPRLGDRTHAA